MPLVPIVLLGVAGFYVWGHTNAPRPTGGGLLAIPVLLAVMTPLIRRMARRETTFNLGAVLWLSLSVKFLGTGFRFLGGVDAVVYDAEGARLATAFRQLDFLAPTGRSIPGTGTIRYLTGIVHVLTNSSYVATFLVFSTLGFCGLMMFYRAVVIALPAANHKRYALALFFCPTLLYWPSSIGKESIMVFGLGLASLGCALLLQRMPRGLLLGALGLTVVSLIRPHVGLIFVTSVIVASVLRAPIGDSLTASIAKAAGIIALVAAGAVLAGATEQLLNVDQLSNTGSIGVALDRTQDQTTQGGAQFDAARINSPADVPWAVVTVLFRPFPFEARSALALLSSAESTAILVGIIASVRAVAGSMVRIRRNAFVAYAMSFVFTFAYLFSAIGNFGILTRQRSQVLPFLLVALALGTPGIGRPSGSGESPPIPLAGVPSDDRRPALKLAVKR